MITMSIEANWERGISGTRIQSRNTAFGTGAAMGARDAEDTPLQSLLSALAGCVIGMGKLVAKEHDLRIDGIACRVEGEVDPDRLVLNGSAARKGCQEIRMTMTVQSTEDEGRLDAWLAEVERRCPIRPGAGSGMSTRLFMKN